MTSMLAFFTIFFSHACTTKTVIITLFSTAIEEDKLTDRLKYMANRTG